MLYSLILNFGRVGRENFEVRALTSQAEVRELSRIARQPEGLVKTGYLAETLVFCCFWHAFWLNPGGQSALGRPAKRPARLASSENRCADDNV